MLSIIKEEYLYRYGNKNFLLLRSLICYYRVLHFRVAVLICAMQKTENLWEKRRIKKKLKLKYNVDIGINSKVGAHPRIEHYSGLVIGNGVIIGDYCTIYQGVTLGQRHDKYPTIGNRVTIYPNAIILGEITVEDNVSVLAGSVVLNDVPSNCLVGGNPARIIKQI